jgi:hypothetical protein
VYVPETGRATNRGDSYAGHHNLAYELLADRRFDSADGSLAELIAELDAAQQPVAVLSSELFQHLYSQLRALRHVRTELNGIGWTVKIIAYLRPQIAYAKSLYLELQKHALSETFSDYLQSILQNGEFAFGELHYQFSYNRLLAAFSGVFGTENILARRYLDDSLSLLDDFIGLLRAGGPAFTLEDFAVPERLNQGNTRDQSHLLSDGLDKLPRLETQFGVDYVTALVRYAGIGKRERDGPGA